MILMIDNYDSFTYNLVQYIGSLDVKIVVKRNDKISVQEIEKLAPNKIVISPGPGYPKDAGISLELIQTFHKSIPILGVCLGHQCIGQAFGGKIVPANKLVHGKSSQISHDGINLYKNIPNPFEAGRYHSLVIEKTSIPPCLKITATTKDGLIMGVRHKDHPVEGFQFHPESILTPEGKELVRNFVKN
jgi:para-aminobenzoate synthetase component II